MANTITLKRSAVQGKVPLTTDLALGEIAINTYDGKLYIKKNDGADAIVGFSATPEYTDFLPQDPPPAQVAGRVYYDSTTKALTYYNDISGSSMQIGFEQWILVRNISGSTITDGSAVVISGSSGQTPTIQLAIATTHDADDVIGLTTGDIANNELGLVTFSGLINNINTASYVEGDTLYLSDSVAGTWSTTIPAFPSNRIKLGVVTNAHATQGKIHVNVRARSFRALNIQFDSQQGIVATNVRDAIDELKTGKADTSHGTHVPAVGTDGQVLTVVSGSPAWADGGGGGGAATLSEVLLTDPAAAAWDFTLPAEWQVLRIVGTVNDAEYAVPSFAFRNATNDAGQWQRTYLSGNGTSYWVGSQNGTGAMLAWGWPQVDNQCLVDIRIQKGITAAAMVRISTMSRSIGGSLNQHTIIAAFDGLGSATTLRLRGRNSGGSTAALRFVKES